MRTLRTSHAQPLIKDEVRFFARVLIYLCHNCFFFEKTVEVTEKKGMKIALDDIAVYKPQVFLASTYVQLDCVQYVSRGSTVRMGTKLKYCK